jgi:branched-chain amino acid transport system permease protein
MAAPIYQVNPLMGADMIIVVSPSSSSAAWGDHGRYPYRLRAWRRRRLTALLSGGPNTVIFVVMVIVLCSNPRDFSDGTLMATAPNVHGPRASPAVSRPAPRDGGAVRDCAVDRLLSGVRDEGDVLRLLPALSTLLGFGGLLSFGHAMLLGTAGYVSAYAASRG